jgi:hypothetical protein
MWTPDPDGIKPDQKIIDGFVPGGADKDRKFRRGIISFLVQPGKKLHELNIALGME